MRRRSFLGVGCAYLAMPRALAAQDSNKVARVGHLLVGSLIGTRTPRHPSAPLNEALYGTLREHGWIEGRNLVVEWRAADGKPERLPDLARQLVSLNVDVIIAPACGAPLDAVRRATATIPIVVATCNDDLVEAGIVRSLAHPGGNITGLSKVTPELSAKRLSLLREILPSASRVGVVWDPDYSDFKADWRMLRAAAEQLKIVLHPVEVRSATEFDAAFTALRRDGADGFLMFSDLVGWFHAKEVAEAAARSRLPGVYAVRQAAEAGGLMSYGPDLNDMFRRAGVYVHRILSGSKAADLPIEQPGRFEFVVNLKTAKALGLTIPPPVLMRATQIIQ
jgi:putative ABC transport system substrate-binding protein